MDITIDLGTGPATHYVEEIFPIDTSIELVGPFVGADAIATLYPDYVNSLDEDDEGTTVAIDGFPAAVGVEDEDGYPVWSAAGLPGVTRVDAGAL